MDGQAIEKITDLAQKNQLIEIDGVQFAPRDYRPIMFRPDNPDTIKVQTISSLVDYLRENRENLDFSTLMIHVKDPKTIDLFEKYKGKEAMRNVFIRVFLDDALPTFPFDQFIDCETFIIKAKALFIGSSELDEIIAIVSKITVQNEINAEDDGISQNIAVKKGISGGLKDQTTTNGMYELTPYRTFREVDQTLGTFILRFKHVENGLPKIALFDVGGGDWKLSAVWSIQKYIRAELARDEINIPVLA